MTRARDLAAFVSNADGDIKFDTDTLFIDSSANRVGIRKTNPDVPLTVDGGSTDNTVAHFTSGTANTYIKLTDSDTTNGVFVGATNEDMTLWTNNTEHMRINSNGTIKQTADSQGSTFAPNTPSTWNALEIFQDRGVTNSASGIAFRSQSGTAPAGIVSVAGNTTGGIESLAFMTSSGNSTAERMRILADGGLTFNGDTAAANALDDYEEGTWTPSITSGYSAVSYNSQVGAYRKIGSLVVFNLGLGIASKTGDSSIFQIGGLPFSKASGTGGSPVSIWTDLWNMGGSNNWANGLISGTSISFYASNLATGGESTLDGNEMNASGGNELYLMGSYITS